MKIIFDRNVLLSAFLTTTGPSAFCFRQAIRRAEIVLSEYILDEAREKLRTKLKIPAGVITQFEKFIRKRAHVLTVQIDTSIEFSDKKDIPILTLAQVASPQYLVTGDKRLLKLKKFDTVLIVTPREAMEILS